MQKARRPTPERQEHYLVDSWLPWDVNQTLSEESRARVSAHVPQCRRCRAELARLQLLQAEVGVPPPAAPVAAPEGLEQLLARITARR